MSQESANSISRRQAILSISAAISLPVIGLPDRVYAGPKPDLENLDYVAVGTFLAASAVLVGVPATVLSPAVKQDDIPLETMYYSMCAGANPDATLAFTNTYVDLRDQGLDDQDIAERLLAFQFGAPSAIRSDEVGCMARLAMQMWLFGVWYGATETSRVTPSNQWITGEWAVDMVVSARGYKNGWIWRIAQAHPMGFSHFNFGSWAADPPDLTDYGIG